MFTDTKGIILRQVKTINGRRMLLIFTEKFGKISVGATVSETRKSGKNNLSTRPFTYGNYEIYQNREYFNLKNANVIRSFYALGEDVDKYAYASYGLELCDKLIPEGQPVQEIFKLTVDYLSTMEERKSRFGTLLLAYKVKLINALGVLPSLKECASCGKKDDLSYFSISEGGIFCDSCLGDAKQSRAEEGVNNTIKEDNTLGYEVDFKKLSVLYYMLANSIEKLSGLALDSEMERELGVMIDRYIDYHLDPGKLKSESFIGV